MHYGYSLAINALIAGLITADAEGNLVERPAAEGEQSP